MHIAEGFLPVSHCVAWAAVSAPFVIHGAVAAKKQIEKQPDTALLLGAAGAFTFVLSALKIPSVTGSSSHPTGTGLGAVLFKPPVMALLGAIVLLFQALLLAHGGITTLGANIFSMAIAGPWVAFGLWKLCKPLGTLPALFIAVVFGDLSTYCVAALQLAAAHNETGLMNAVLGFLMVYAPTQVPLAIVEGIISVLIFRSLRVVATKELSQLGLVKASEQVPAAADPASTYDMNQPA